MNDETVLRLLDPDYDRVLSTLPDGRPLYYDRQGRGLGLFEWGRLLQDRAYAVVAQTLLGFSNGNVLVSTVWLGMDHSLYGLAHPPVIFETMVFGGRRWDQYRARWCTEGEARAGHERVVEAVRLDRRPSSLVGA